jgi:hypothetical protein
VFLHVHQYWPVRVINHGRYLHFLASLTLPASGTDRHVNWTIAGHKVPLGLVGRTGAGVEYGGTPCVNRQARAKSYFLA